MLNGEPSIMWKYSEVSYLIIQEKLQYTIIGKFLYSKPYIKSLRKAIPTQCGIKKECIIGLLCKTYSY